MIDLLWVVFIIAILVSLYLSHRFQRQATEHASAAAYYAGLYDGALAVSGEKPSQRERRWADEDWYLKHCAGAADELAEERT